MALRLGGIKQPRCDFFYFIPLSLGAKLEFSYIEKMAINITGAT